MDLRTVGRCRHCGGILITEKKSGQEGFTSLHSVPACAEYLTLCAEAKAEPKGLLMREVNLSEVDAAAGVKAGQVR